MFGLLFFSWKIFFKFQLFQYNIGFSLRQLQKFCIFVTRKKRGKKRYLKLYLK